MKAYIDATVLIALGNIGELDRLSVFDAEPVMLSAVREAVTTEPAGTALDQAVASGILSRQPDPPEQRLQGSASILEDPIDTADVHLIAAVLDARSEDRSVAVISDDRRVRTVARGLGATVTCTIGVIVRGVEAGLDPESAKSLIRRLDEQGLHMTARLWDRAFDLIDSPVE